MSDDSRRSPINTSAQPSIVHLMGALTAQSETGNPSNAILQQESRGQASFVNSDTLPTEARDYGDSISAQKVLEAAGVKFGEVVPGDSLFQYVELPQGWKKVPTDHSMWSHLVDEKGRTRADIFYKAAFYDRSATYNVVSRYSISVDYERREKDGVTVAQVLDGKTVVYTTEPLKESKEEARYQLSERATKAAVAWADEHLPNWDKADANWD